jgi:hypothetical protein
MSSAEGMSVVTTVPAHMEVMTTDPLWAICAATAAVVVDVIAVMAHMWSAEDDMRRYPSGRIHDSSNMLQVPNMHVAYATARRVGNRWVVV